MSFPGKLTKSGYLWYAETKTFGTHWTRLFFCIKKGMLVSAEVSWPANYCSHRQFELRMHYVYQPLSHSAFKAVLNGVA